MKKDFLGNMWSMAPESATRRDVRLRWSVVKGAIECAGGLLSGDCTFFERRKVQTTRGSSCVICDVGRDADNDVGSC